MHKIHYEAVQETVHHERLENGLNVYLVPKPGYAKTYAVFSTRYGSIDNHFQVEGAPEKRVTDGIAHFLEHKLFEEEWGDIFHTFAEAGASANAFTGHNRTAYLFSATHEVEKNLETLLDFVQRPHISPESVEKEKGIIEQEIRMYDDMPFWRAYRHLLENLYQHSPVRIDIAGTVESIGRIDRAALLTCYETFYHPANMVLVVVGDFDPERVMGLVRENQAKKSFPPARVISRFYPDEPAACARARSEVRLAVSRPLVMLGWKDAAGTPEADQIRRELVMALIQSLLFGQASPLFQHLLDTGLVDEPLSFDYEIGPGYGFSYLGTETDDPARFQAEIERAIGEAVAKGLDPDAFERTRRKLLGEFLHGLNSPEAIANAVTEVALLGQEYFRVPLVISAITQREAEAVLREHFAAGRMVASIVSPLETVGATAGTRSSSGT